MSQPLAHPAKNLKKAVPREAKTSRISRPGVEAARLRWWPLRRQSRQQQPSARRSFDACPKMKAARVARHGRPLEAASQMPLRRSKRVYLAESATEARNNRQKAHKKTAPECSQARPPHCKFARCNGADRGVTWPVVAGREQRTCRTASKQKGRAEPFTLFCGLLQNQNRAERERGIGLRYQAVSPQEVLRNAPFALPSLLLPFDSRDRGLLSGRRRRTCLLGHPLGSRSPCLALLCRLLFQRFVDRHPRC